MTDSSCSIWGSNSSLCLPLTPLSVVPFSPLRYLRSVIHSAYMPSKPRTCHHRSPPTTVANSSGPNQSIRRSAARLHEERETVTGTTAAQKGDGMCVLVLHVCVSLLIRPRCIRIAYKACRDSILFCVPSSMNDFTMLKALFPHMPLVPWSMLPV